MHEVDADLKFNMDLIQFMRRIRMHGFALTVLLDKPFRMFTAKRSKRKALETISGPSKNKLWNKYEPDEILGRAI